MQDFSRRVAIKALGTLVVTAAMPVAAQQIFSGKTVRLVLGFQAGTPPDLVGRLISSQLTEQLGGTFIVEPRPGAGERVAAQLVATAPPDGTTLLLMTGGQTIVAATDPTVRYDMLKDFRYVSMLVQYPFFLAVSAESKYRTLKELLSAARENPGKLTYASAGIGTTTQLGMELLLKSADASMLHVPYTGGARVVNDIQSGAIDVWFTTLSGGQALVAAGKLRMLAVTSKERDPGAPDVPSVSETVPNYDVTTWLALCAPAGTSDQIVERLTSAIKVVMTDATIRERCLSLGLTPHTNTPEEMRSRVVADIAKWKPFEALVK